MLSSGGSRDSAGLVVVHAPSLGESMRAELVKALRQAQGAASRSLPITSQGAAGLAYTILALEFGEHGTQLSP
jgi:3-deoxy-D-manno-octulosonic-acid transferase